MTGSGNADSAIPPAPEDAASRALMPNLFVIGASKAGSSALHRYLKAHPEICMSREKEPCFFVEQDELKQAWPIMAHQDCSQSWPAYLDLWRGGETARYRGEGSVFYSQSPHRSGVAARIARHCPEAKIIYSVREPVRRAIGHYWQRQKEFYEQLPLGEAVRQNPLYRDTSDYAMQLEYYLEHFPRSQIKIVVAEDLRTRRREVLADLFEWLELPPFEPTDEQLIETHKSPPTSRKERLPLVASVRNSAAWATARRFLPASAVDALRTASTTTFDKAQVDETAAREYLHEYLDPRRAAFEALLGYRIEAWDRR